MNKVASYLQSHIAGEVSVSDAIREHFSTDASVLSIKPNLVAYPRTTNDIRKIARFSWQLAEKGHVLPITARGSGTDMTGAAIGTGIVMVMPSHLNKILELDTKQKLVRVQPGLNYASLQETLHTHGLYLPVEPESAQYSTIGGAIANNASGGRSSKYGDIREWVDKLEVVLANGEVIQTEPLSKKEFNKKLGLPTLEGELYRAVDAILNDSLEVVENGFSRALKDNAGYELASLRKKSTTDLTGLFVGSQGTLGVITEAILRVTSYTPESSLVVAGFANIDDALEAAEALVSLKPSRLEVVDVDAVAFAQKHSGVALPEALADANRSPALLFAETNDDSPRARNKFTKRVVNNLSKQTDRTVVASDADELEQLWALRYATSAFVSSGVGGKTAVPAVEQVSLPAEALHQFVGDAKTLCKKHHCEAAVWIRVEEGIVGVLPLFDLSKLGDRQQVFKLMDDYYRLVIKLGGSVVGSSGEGRLRMPFSRLQQGDELVAVNEQLRAAADPHGTLNPGVKQPTETRTLVDLLRKDYNWERFADHLPKM